MKTHSYSIHPEIFQLYPGYVRGVVIANEVHNSETPGDLVYLLRKTENTIRQKMNIDTLLQDERIISWREAFRKFGAKPGEYRSSIEALVRRILKGDSLPSINALVDIGNIISLRHMLPVGGHAIDHLNGNLSLRFSTGKEEFIPVGMNNKENPERGEVVFVDEDIVLTRRWTWRQGNHTLTLPTTSSIEYNIDGLPPMEPKLVEKACRELADLIMQYCQGRVKIEVLSELNPRITLSE